MFKCMNSEAKADDASLSCLRPFILFCSSNLKHNKKGSSPHILLKIIYVTTVLQMYMHKHSQLPECLCFPHVDFQSVVSSFTAVAMTHLECRCVLVTTSCRLFTYANQP